MSHCQDNSHFCTIKNSSQHSKNYHYHLRGDWVQNNSSFCLVYSNQIILIYLTYLICRTCHNCLLSHQNSIIAKSKEAHSLFGFPKLIVNSTNGFFLTQTVLALTKFENMSLTKSSPSSDSGSFQHFFSVASTTVEGSFIHKNRRVLS